MTGRGDARRERVWYPAGPGGPRPGALPRLVSLIYGAAVAARNAAYDRGLARVRPVPVPCVSVGNLTVGGTGKTPLVAWLAEAVLGTGRRPAVVSRGYGGTERGPALVPPAGGAAVAARYGDEPALLAAALPAVPVVVGADRHAAAAHAVAACGAEVVVADDAFQHRRLGRDLDIVVVDAARLFGNGLLLPAGPLREPPSALGRAGLVLLARIGEAPDPGRARDAVARLAPAVPVAEADLRFAGWRDALGGGAADLPPAARVHAFCGIANPASFRRTLEGIGLEVARLEAFPDHHRFLPAELAGIAAAADAAGAPAVVTTAKDAVRIGSWPGRAPLYRAEVKLAIIRGHEHLWELLTTRAARGRA